MGVTVCSFLIKLKSVEGEPARVVRRVFVRGGWLNVCIVRMLSFVVYG